MEYGRHTVRVLIYVEWQCELISIAASACDRGNSKECGSKLNLKLTLNRSYNPPT